MTEYDWPFEIREAVDSLESDTEWKILAATVDGAQEFSELQSILPETLDDEIDAAVSTLAAGGLVQKRSAGDPTRPRAYRVELSEYGSRFVEALFDTLGSAEAEGRGSAESPLNRED